MRRRGYSPEDAQDLTQEFFARLLSREQLARVDRQKGKFRSWLLGVMNHFLAHQWEKARAQKRGGGEPQFPFDSATPEGDAEHRYRMEPADQCTPERLFERRWAFTVLDQAAVRLRNEYCEAGKQNVYGVLKEFVSHEADAMTYAEAAQRLRLSEGGTKAAVHRLRQRYQAVIREEIAQTVATATEVDEEIRYLLKVIRG